MFFSRRNKQFEELNNDELMQSVGNYVRYIEVERTSKTCKCETEVHQDDINLPAGKPRRLRVIEMNLTCPVHTREGFLLGYFDFMRRGNNGS